MNSDYLIVMDDITKEFPSVKALKDVTIKVREGSILGLVGENGAGKSTLMKILSGQYTEYSGQIYWKGRPVHFQNERQALDQGIAIVPQELNPIPDLTIAENIFIGREKTNKYGLVANKAMSADAKQLFDLIGVDFNPNQKLRYLSVAQKQMVEIVKAISRSARLIIMDEPSSALTSVETKGLFEQIRRLHDEGITIIYISHKLEEIFQICSEVTVLRDGAVIGFSDIGSLNFAKVINMMVGRNIENLFPPVNGHKEEVMLSVKDLSRHPRFRNISFDLKAGEILGIAGMMGSGRSEIMRVIFGMDRPDSGSITVDGKTVKIRSVKDAIKNGIVMVTEDRAIYGFVGVRSIRDNILLPNTDLFAPRFFIKQKEIKDAANDLCVKLGIKTPNILTSVHNLSGGNQQKVVLAKWVIRDVKIMIMDEPTRGIDVGAKYEIYKIITALSEQGISVIMISSELPEVIGMCHRILILADGRFLGEMNRGDVTQEKIMEVIVKNKGRI
jgi:ABC-type sugar transport system ATPase subunit